jgi:hypothetical protein
VYKIQYTTIIQFEQDFKIGALMKILSTHEAVVMVTTEWSSRERSLNGSRPVFALDNDAIADADLGDRSMLLPLVMWHADALYSYTMNPRGLGLSFVADPDAMLLNSIDVGRSNRSASEILLFTIEALNDLRLHLPKSTNVNGAVQLRPMVDTFVNALKMAAEESKQEESGAHALMKP